MVMIKRKLFDVINNQLFSGKAIVLMGARQTGKTTLLEQLFKTRNDVLWLSGDKGARELGRIAGKIDDALGELGIERDTRKFKAHLTLARLKDTTLPEELVRRLGDVPVLSWDCGNLVLMRSLLTPKGPIYSELL
mgnify:CR=1 FL=1